MASRGYPLTALVAFDRALKVAQVSSHEYCSNIIPESCFGVTAHGGAVVSTIWRAVELHFQTTNSKLNQHNVISFHIEFLRPMLQGEIKISVKDVRVGKGSSTVAVSVTQRGKDTALIHAIVLSEPLQPSVLTRDLAYRHNHPLPDFTALENNRDANWIIGGFRANKNPATAIHHVTTAVLRRPSPDLRQWEVWYTPRLPGVNWKTSDVGILADMNFMVPEAYYPDNDHSFEGFRERCLMLEREGKDPLDHPTWRVPRFYTTANMNLDMRRQLPPEGEKWLMLRGTTRELVNGRFDIQTEIWDTQNRLIAIIKSLWFCVDLSKRPGLVIKESSSKI